MFVERVTLANVVAVMLMVGDTVGERAHQFDGRAEKETVGGAEAIRLEFGTVSEDRLSVFCLQCNTSCLFLRPNMPKLLLNCLLHPFGSTSPITLVFFDSRHHNHPPACQQEKKMQTSWMWRQSRPGPG